MNRETDNVPIASSIFMDSDNFISGMDGGDISISILSKLLASLAKGDDNPPFNQGRRFLRRRAYLNFRGEDPHASDDDQRKKSRWPSLDAYYRILAESGFEIIDCQNVGRANKSNADVRIAFDIATCLRDASAPLSECIVMTGDADFAPVLQAIRATGTWTTLVSTKQNTNPALAKQADVYIDKQIAYKLMDLQEISLTQPKKTRIQRPASEPKSPEKAKKVAISYVEDLLKDSDEAIQLPALGIVLRQKIGSDYIDQSNWFGFGKLSEFLRDAFSNPKDKQKFKIAGQHIWDTNKHDAPEGYRDIPMVDL